MNEIVNISGRFNEYIDPTLTIWPWPIPLYLFVAGMASGILIFCGLKFLKGKSDKFEAAVYKAPMIVPLLLIVGLTALFYDLSHKLYFWRLYTSFSLEATMSWGSWVLMVITPVSFAWATITNRKYFTTIIDKYPLLDKIEGFLSSNKKFLVWILFVFGILLGFYTSLLLTGFIARPLWNTPLLALSLFTSALSTGAAVISLLSKSPDEKRYFTKTILVLLLVKMLLIISFLAVLLTGIQVQIDAARLLIGGPFTIAFGFFFVLGLITPVVLNILELNGKKIPSYVAPALVILGGFMLRFILVHAGQVSTWM